MTAKTIGESDIYQLIKDTISEEITYKENTFFHYTKLADALFELIFVQEINTDDIVTSSSLIDGIIVETTIEGKYITPENIKELRQWLKEKLLPSIHKKIISLSNKSETDIKHKDKLITLVDKAISYHKGLEEEIQFIDTEGLGDILYHLIFENKLSLKEIIQQETINGVIGSSIIADIGDKVIDEVFVANITRWLKDHVIPYIYEHKREYEYIREYETSTTELHILTKREEEYLKLIYKSTLPLNNIENIYYFDTNKLVQALYKYIIELDYPVGKLSKTSLISDIIDQCINYTNEPVNVSFSQLKDDVRKILIKEVIPAIYVNIRFIDDKKYVTKEVEIPEKYEKEKSQYESIPELKPIDFTINEDSKLYERMTNIVRSFYDSFYDESSMCSYYTYYLLKLKGNKDFDFEFRLLENKLYDDFYNYGIFAILGELRHFLGQFIFRKDGYSSMEISNYIDYPSIDNPEFRFRNGFDVAMSDIAECVGIDVEDIYKIIKIEMIYHYTNKRYYANVMKLSDKEREIIKNVEFLYLIEKYFGYFTRPETILKVALKCFEATQENNEKCYWMEQYGGEPWASITKTMLSRNFITSKTIFVDTCWSLQHNTSLFLDKIYSGKLYILKDYLSEVKDGLFKNVYECAIKHNTKLDRWIYRNIVLENDSGISNIQYKIEPEPQHGRFDYTKSSVYRREDDEPLPEKEDIDLTTHNDREKNIIYEEIDGTWGLNTAKINKIGEGSNPTVEIIIEQEAYRYITDLNSIMKYMNKHYPLSEEQKVKSQVLNIENVIIDNVTKLPNKDMQTVINLNIDYEKMAEKLQVWIYKKHYTSLEIKSKIDFLMNDSLKVPIDHDYETYRLIKIWITDYLIDDLVKSTPLQLGGLDVLFG